MLSSATENKQINKNRYKKQPFGRISIIEKWLHYKVALLNVK